MHVLCMDSRTGKGGARSDSSISDSPCYCRRVVLGKSESSRPIVQELD